MWMSLEPRFQIGDLVRFKDLSEFSEAPSRIWLDINGNEIPEGSMGLVVGITGSFSDFLFDVHLPMLGITTTNWGGFALMHMERL